MVCHMMKVSDWNIDGRAQTGSSEEIKVWKARFFETTGILSKGSYAKYKTIYSEMVFFLTC